MNEIIIDVGLYENRVAIIEENELVEIFHERKEDKKIQGNVYKGRVVNVLPGMQAAFINIGLEKNAFLYVRDAVPKSMLNQNIDIKSLSIKDLVKQGQELIVQVIKEPYGTKGARVTTHITLPGRYLVLMPYNTYVGVSRKISSEEERERLKKVAESIRPEDMGLILRTASKDKTEEDLKQDIDYLVNIYSKIDRERNLGTSPRVIYKDFDLLGRTIRDMFTKKIDKILINDKNKYEDLLELSSNISPNLKSRIHYFERGDDLFKVTGIDSKIKSALDKKVWLKSGGYIIIDETEALTSIDVNTGKFVGSINLKDTVYKTNIEAAKEITKQLRLRNIGGIIIIDFIDMTNKEDEENLINVFKNELKKDRTKTTVLGITQLGLLEMTRKKSRNKLSTRLLSECPCCNGTSKIKSTDFLLTKIEKEAERVSIHTSAEGILFELNPFKLKEIIEDYKDMIEIIENHFNIKIYMVGNEDLKIDDLINKKMGRIIDIEKIMD
ncbi:Rne/Rng family ribonuclease [Clostridium sp. D2Q-11]|uniref:Rne/Rng family ribonuclease n=1 Tax=Anaeromonas frigoriresistens TaxID=2683708 RepID=A0A942UVG4_9FIRM|nr:Rne/Rng family ribonuclease [Anaeromonas frigoriresistens]MBS4537166.1 Rne/Rng family ribonuclease [Anaeromonas frigoriresistens]